MSFNIISRFNYNTDVLTKKAAGLINSRFGLWFLGLLSFVESLLLIPLITDPFMAAYIMVHKDKAVRAVVVTTVTSMLGGLIAYITAAFFIDLIIGYLSADTIMLFNQMVSVIKEETFTLAFLGAVTPVPFTLTALAAGTIKGNLALFLLGALVGRALRYSLVGYFSYKFGHRAMELAQKNIIILSVVTVVVVAVYVFFKM